MKKSREIGTISRLFSFAAGGSLCNLPFKFCKISFKVCHGEREKPGSFWPEAGFSEGAEGDGFILTKFGGKRPLFRRICEIRQYFADKYYFLYEFCGTIFNRKGGVRAARYNKKQITGGSL